MFRDPGLDPKDLLFILLFQPISHCEYRLMQKRLLALLRADVALRRGVSVRRAGLRLV